jgi:hypothetical protein
MLANVSKSACTPAPPVGSEAAKVRTIGGTNSVSTGMEVIVGPKRKPVVGVGAIRHKILSETGQCSFGDGSISTISQYPVATHCPISI